MAEPKSSSRHTGRKRLHRRKSYATDDRPVDIRVGNRRAAGYHVRIQVFSAADAGRFRRVVDDTVRSNPGDPIIISINDYQPWLENVLSSCIDDRWSELSGLDRELQFADTVKFPERSTRRSKMVPWSFIVDEMNVPEVYYWTFGQLPPNYEFTSNVDDYRFRVAVWTCGRGAFRGDSRIPVTVVFTKPTDIAEHVVHDLLFPRLYLDQDQDSPRHDEEGVCWIFLRLYWLLSDWQNVIREIERELGEAELNSRGRTFPVKLRTRAMHKQVDRLYDLKQYLQFQTRSFKKLIKLKASIPKAERNDLDPIWDEMDNAVDDLDQYDYNLDSLKERFNNLIELEFNIENASQSDYSRFLSVIAALYLPISYLASVNGITTITAPAILYLYIAIPLLIISLAFTIIFPWAITQIQRYRYPYESKHLQLPRQSFTMLGDELPDNADVPRNVDINTCDRASSRRRSESSVSILRPEPESRWRTRSNGRRSKRSERDC